MAPIGLSEKYLPLTIVANPKELRTKQEKQNFKEKNKTHVSARIEKDMNQTKSEDSDRSNKTCSKDIMNQSKLARNNFSLKIF